MTKFGWTPSQIEDIRFPKVQMILERMKEEHRIQERERRIAKLKSKRRR